MSDIRRMMQNMAAHAVTNSDTWQEFQALQIRMLNREEEAKKNADKRSESQFNKEKD